MPFSQADDEYSSSLPIAGFWAPQTLVWRPVTVTFTNPLQPAADLDEGAWDAVGGADAKQWVMQKRLFHTFGPSLQGEIRSGFIQSSEDPYISYDGSSNDLYGADGKPIAPFSVELLPI